MVIFYVLTMYTPNHPNSVFNHVKNHVFSMTENICLLLSIKPLQNRLNLTKFEKVKLSNFIL